MLWPLLRERCIVNDLTMFYKINRALVSTPLPSEIIPRFLNTRESNDLNFTYLHVPSSFISYKYLFYPCTIEEWNSDTHRHITYCHYVPTSGLLAVETNDSFLLWLAKFKYQKTCLWTLNIAMGLPYWLSVKILLFSLRPLFCLSVFCVIVYRPHSIY